MHKSQRKIVRERMCKRRLLHMKANTFDTWLLLLVKREKEKEIERERERERERESDE